tara:strand:+ start:280 stop:516 length:237 start_codon:yes stop_codon:yes gene_type:complete
MTNEKNNSQDKITDAGTVELEENELDNVTGGAGAAYLKIGDIHGEISSIDDKIGKVGIKIGTAAIKIDNLKDPTRNKF